LFYYEYAFIIIFDCYILINNIYKYNQKKQGVSKLPKLLDNIEERINNSAFNLFAEKGYNQVTMKMIAQDVGISVGTLYNYYSNKKDLFLKSFKLSFDHIYFSLNNIIEKEKGTYEFIKFLYNEIVKLKRFGMEIISNKNDNKVVVELKNHLLMLMRFLVYRAEEKNDLDLSNKDKERVIRVLILSLHDFAQEFPEDKEDNINFICQLIDKIK
jgi:AcrR family transcriptional regulator